jgi:hypothetical protein
MYILTKEEYDTLIEKSHKLSKDTEETLQDLCTRVANSEVVKEGWYKGHAWECYLTKEDWYCDWCPVRSVCPYPYKEVSK